MRQGRSRNETQDGTQPKTGWRLISGDARRVHKVIDEILDSTGDDTFEVEFRVYRSTRTATPAAEPERPKPTAPSRPAPQKRVRKRRRPRHSSLPWQPAAIATVPIAISIGYLLGIAPSMVPLPADVALPFPAVTRFVEQVCLWCGEFPVAVVLIAVTLLTPGFFFRSLREPQRYYVPLAVVVSVALGLAHVSLSVTNERPANAVEAIAPDPAGEREVPPARS